eukprot:evm.model.scf_206EXC.9 EVM.evm.TU.scf_206EXC.9   scf_206EXC:105101-116496(-)
MDIKSVNVIQFLGLFIILGIGIDDVFVLYDTYTSSLPSYWNVHATVRLSHAYRKAGAAMAVTSFTSAIAFAANVISPIPAVQLFGIFLAIMVAANYYLVMTWLPACIAFYEKYVLGPRARCADNGNTMWTVACWLFCGPMPRSYLDVPWDESGTTNRAWTFWQQHSKLIYKWRFVFLLVLLCLSTMGTAGLLRLQGSRSVPSVFPPDHNVQVFLDLWESTFLSSGSCDRCWRAFQQPLGSAIPDDFLASLSAGPAPPATTPAPILPQPSSSVNEPTIPPPFPTPAPLPPLPVLPTPIPELTSPNQPAMLPTGPYPPQTPAPPISQPPPVPSTRPPPPAAVVLPPPAPPMPLPPSGALTAPANPTPPPFPPLSPTSPALPGPSLAQQQSQMQDLIEGAFEVQAVANTSVELSWTSLPSSSIDEFILEYRREGDTLWYAAYNGLESEFVIDGLAAGVTYELRLATISSLGTVYGDPLTAETDDFDPPGAPYNLSLLEATTNSLWISWEQADSPNAPVNGFNVILQTATDSLDTSLVTYSFGASTTMALLGPLASGTAYLVQVVAVNAAGEAMASSQFATLPSTAANVLQSQTVASPELGRAVRVSTIQPAAPSRRRLLDGQSSESSNVYIVLEALEGDQTFPIPRQIEGDGNLARTVDSGAGTSVNLAKVEELIAASLESNTLAGDDGSGPTGTRVVIIENLPSDDQPTYTRWLSGDLVQHVESDSVAAGESGRLARGIVGYGRGSVVAYRTAMTRPDVFGAAALVHPPTEVAGFSPPILSGLSLPAHDLFMYTSHQWPAAQSAFLRSGCRLLDSTAISDLITAVGECSLFEDPQARDVSSSALTALDFLATVFKARAVEQQIPDKPKRSNTVLVNVIWGLRTIDRSTAKTDPFSMFRGDPVYDERFDITSEATQLWILEVCERLENMTNLVEKVDKCFVRDWKAWLQHQRRADIEAPRFPVPSLQAREQLWKFAAASRQFNNHLGYVIDGAFSEFPRPKWVRITMRSKVDNRVSSELGYEEWLKWNRALLELNLAAPESAGEMIHTTDLWVRSFTEREVVQATVWAIVIAAICALLAILVFTGSPRLSFIAVLNLACIVVSMLGFFYLLGWTLGVVEAISVTILVGMSVDFTLHVSEAYSNSKSRLRGQR